MFIKKTRYTYLLLNLLLIINVPAIAQVNFNSSNLPIIIIETNGQEILDEPRIVADMKVIDNGENRNFLSESKYTYNGKISIEIRGSTSQSFPKKQYGFETQNDDGSNNNVSLLGLPSENDWILYAPFSDKTFIRNIIAYQLSERLGHYAPRTRLCELSLNGEYKGVYVLIEKIKRDDNRVDIAKLNPDEIAGDDLTGGYIIKIDKTSGNSGPVWQSDIGGINFQYEYPKYSDIVTEQEEYIRNYIDNFEKALISEDFMDADVGFRRFIDENSFVDYFIANEVSKNIDGYFLSTYFFKDKDSKGGKLTMGPLWDFNLSYGNADYREGFLTDGFQVEINPSPWWWERLLQDSIFKNKITIRWENIRNDFLSDNRVGSTIDSLSILLDEAQQRNFERWNIMGYKIWPNYYVGNTYEDEINFLKTWTLDRLHWLDNNLYFDQGQNSAVNVLANSAENIITNLYPNPFSSYFNCSFLLKEPANISIILYNSSGIQITKIVDNRYYSEGEVLINWNADEIPGAMYFVVLKINGEIITREKIIKI